MSDKLNENELASSADNVVEQVDYDRRAKRYLKAIGKAPSRPVSKDARELHSRVRTAVKYLRQQQRDHRQMCAADVMPSYEMLSDTLANLICDMWAYIEQSKAEGEA